MREVITMNGGWRFYKGGDPEKVPKKAKKDWQEVTLPHTWNAQDGQDGGSDFWRGSAWYFKEIPLNLPPSRQAYLEFEGVGMSAKVYVNGKLAGSHEGGFSTFRVNLTPYVRHKKAKIAVLADNSDNQRVYPQMADFTFFGGIYREVKLLLVEGTHFALEEYGASGVQVVPTLEGDGSARVKVRAQVEGRADATVRLTLMDEVKTAEREAVFLIKEPHLWDGVKDPYLYAMKAEVLVDGAAVDEITIPFGVRSFAMDAEKGFLLNGRPYPLRGVSRHQDRLNKGWAISKEDHEEDVALIKEVGANSVRLAHYQHAPYFYDLCDRAGLVVWAEIPFISVFLPTPEAKANTLSQMRELVLQNLHRPSIVCWGIANEITIGEADAGLSKNLEELAALCHTLDATRPTAMASVSMLEGGSPLNKIPDVLAYNHYFGWYMGDVADNGPWLDDFHQTYPDISLGLSEYGCEANVALHSAAPKVQDYSEEYQAYYHEEMLKTFAQRPWLWCTYVWNMFDFASDMRDEGGVKGRNQKGLVTYDRKIKKDSFYIYKAWWSGEPFVHLCSRRWRERTAPTAEIKVYSNQPEVTLFVNGREAATLAGDKIFRFPAVALQEGENVIRAVSGACTDEMTLVRTNTPSETYALPEAPVGEGAANWFEGMAGEGGELQFPDGRFSIRDKLGDIMKTPAGNQLIQEMLVMISEQMGMKVSKGMLNMAKSMTIERIFEMAGSRVPEGAKLFLNEKLNGIEK